jgi:hypothetical protein
MHTKVIVKPKESLRTNTEKKYHFTWMYIQEMGRMDALPQGAPATAPMALLPPVLTTGCPGKKGARRSTTPIGPIPGPAQ